MKYADRILRLEDRSLLEAFELPVEDHYISFSGGFPSPETYPVEAISQAFLGAIAEAGPQAFAYASTSGLPSLRKKILGRMEAKWGVHYDMDEIIITSGSQQGLDMSGMLFVNKGDVILFETPSYLGAVNALRAYEAELVGVPTDHDGIEIDALKDCLEKYGERVKMIYVIPDYQNPTGRSWSSKRREDFMKLLENYEVPVIEDGAYSELSFEKEPTKPLCAYDSNGQVVYVGTFSKTFCPGLRVAWLCAHKDIMEKYLVLKNASDLASSTVGQYQMAYYMEHFDMDKHIEDISLLYKHRRNVMADAIDQYFPEEVNYVLPKGGLFIWAELPEGKDTRELLKRAIEKNVTFIPGSSFYPGDKRYHEMRLNFSNMADEDTVEGIQVLGALIKEYLAE